MAEYILDIETNGFLEELDRVHSIVLTDTETAEVRSFTDHPYDRKEGDIVHGLSAMDKADRLVFHNGIKFDVPAIVKVFPGTASWLSEIDQMDTLVLSRLIWPEIKKTDFARLNKGKNFPKRLVGRHSLEAWGHRLGEYKGNFNGPFDEWSVAMQEYCEQDTLVTLKLWNLIRNKKRPSKMSVWIEHEFQKIIFEQEQSGFPFNEREAKKLYAEWSGKRDEIDAELRNTFQPLWLPSGKLVKPKATRKVSLKEYPPRKRERVSKRTGKPLKPVWDHPKAYYHEGSPYQPVKLTEFNPASRDHIALWLKRLHGWKPTEFTKDGKPKVDETVLSGLKFPEAEMLHEYLLINKRIGQLAEGKEAWLKRSVNGIIHGTVITNGAVTGRCTHKRPNMSQVPAPKSRYGPECRALFGPFPGEVQVGFDASGIELRMLAHFMARYDGGKYAEALIKGNKEDETDVHSLNCKALGMEPKKLYTIRGKQSTGRDIAKRFIYALLYGAGDPKIGVILGVSTKKAKQIKARFFKKLPALGRLIGDVREKVKKSGHLIGVDKRVLRIRSAHSALNTLLQSAGGITMKLADILFWQKLRENNLHRDVRQLGHFHDEIQTSQKKEIANEVGQLGVEAIHDAGEMLKIRCPLDGDFDIGANWAECH